MIEGFRPLGGRIVVRVIDPDGEVKVGEHTLHVVREEKPSEGVVVSVGPGERDQQGVVHPLVVSPGDHVVYMKYGGTEFELDGEKLLILRESDVLGVRE